MKHTIKSKRQITALFSEGVRTQTAGIVAISKATAATSGRIAVIAGKRLGSAPLRNRAKRLIREAARLNGAPWDNYDVALIAKERLLAGGFALAQSDLRRISQRLADQRAKTGERL
jgi:ribonuclease P protein component